MIAGDQRLRCAARPRPPPAVINDIGHSDINVYYRHYYYY